MPDRGSRALVRLGLIAWCLLLILGGWEWTRAGIGSGSLLGRFSVKWALALGGYLAISVPMLIGSLSGMRRPERIWPGAAHGLERLLGRFGRLRLLIAALAAIAPTLLILGPWGDQLGTPLARVVMLLAGAGLAALAFPASGRSLAHRFALATLAVAALFVLAGRLILVSDYPFKLGWSEGNRLWDYSLYFARGRYRFADEFAYPGYLTPGRHGLWGLAYLLPGAGILLVRLWDAALWILPYLLLSWLLLARTRGSWSGLIPLLWGFLFLHQGGVFAPLVLSGALLAWAYDSRHPPRTLAATALACFYAGISRWTWLIAPAVWAALWALLRSPSKESGWRRLWYPAQIGLAGSIGGLASQAVMAIAFPRPAAVYETSFSQPLLWYRLLPNPTYPTGILPALILAIGPLCLLLAWGLRAGVLQWDGWGQVGALAALVAFGAVGIVASVKIGGGSNLHNLDMLWMALLFLAAAGLEGWRRLGQRPRLPISIQATIAALVLIPSLAAIQSAHPPQLPGEDTVERALQTVREHLQAAVGRGQVLFIDQRQLLTFGQVQNLPLVTEYELKEMANQAMASNTAYFAGLEADLQAHRFALILSDPVAMTLQGSSHQFGEENDAWVNHISVRLLRYYRPVEKLDEVRLWLLEPIEPGS